MTEATQSTPELLPCPNPWRHSCGVPLPAFSARTQRWHVACACGVRSSSADTEAEAITAWNTRSTPDRNAVLEEAASDREINRQARTTLSAYMDAKGHSWERLADRVENGTHCENDEVHIGIAIAALECAFRELDEVRRRAALTTTPEPTDPADPPTCGMCGGDKRIAVTTPADAPNAGWAACPKCSVDPAGVSEMDDDLERWADIQDDDAAIVACGDRWKAVASLVGCQLHGFNDGRCASFTTPDGNVIEVGPKFRKAIVALRTPSPVLEVAKERRREMIAGFEELLRVTKPNSNVARLYEDTLAALRTPDPARVSRDALASELEAMTGGRSSQNERGTWLGTHMREVIAALRAPAAGVSEMAELDARAEEWQKVIDAFRWVPEDQISVEQNELRLDDYQSSIGNHSYLEQVHLWEVQPGEGEAIRAAICALPKLLDGLFDDIAAFRRAAALRTPSPVLGVVKEALELALPTLEGIAAELGDDLGADIQEGGRPPQAAFDAANTAADHVAKVRGALQTLKEQNK